MLNSITGQEMDAGADKLRPQAMHAQAASMAGNALHAAHVGCTHTHQARAPAPVLPTPKQPPMITTCGPTAAECSTLVREPRLFTTR